mgnify:FL=1
MNKVIITGPECSGKTTLSEDLSLHYNSLFNNEYARDYIKSLNRSYIIEDLLKIAQKQWENEHNNLKQKFLICDTDLITIKIWSEYKFKRCDKWIVEKIEEQKKEKRLYLLCKPDIKWEFDPLRESKFERDILFELYKKELLSLKHSFTIIDKDQRTEKAIKKINNFFI